MIAAMQRTLRWIFFNLKYIGRPPWDTGISPPELQAFIKDHAPGRALDLGCGTGTNLLAMAEAGWEVWGVDYALRAVLVARRRLRRAGFGQRSRVISGDVTGMAGLPGQFDLVLDIGCYHGVNLPDRAAYRRNLLRWLAPQGKYLLYAHLVDEVKPGGFGFDSTDLAALGQDLALVTRQDSNDRWERRASWMLWQRRLLEPPQ